MSDTFGVGIQVTEDELRFVVHLPSEVDSGWTDPQAFQTLVEEVVWDRLDRESALGEIATHGDAGATVSLGTVTLEPDGTVLETTLSEPTLDTE